MGTDNRRVAAYLPKEIDDRLKEFISERGLKGDSPALIEILSEYFGVSRQVAQSVDYSLFVTQSQFEELAAKVSELSAANEKSIPLGSLISKLPDRVRRLEDKVAFLEIAKSQGATLSTGELAKRLGIDSSTLSHWKSTGKKGKSPDELLKATREKDPEGIGWIVVPENGKFKPERDLLGSPSDGLQGSLLGEVESEPPEEF